MGSPVHPNSIQADPSPVSSCFVPASSFLLFYSCLLFLLPSPAFPKTLLLLLLPCNSQLTLQSPAEAK